MIGRLTFGEKGRATEMQHEWSGIKSIFRITLTERLEETQLLKVLSDAPLPPKVGVLRVVHVCLPLCISEKPVGTQMFYDVACMKDKIVDVIT